MLKDSSLPDPEKPPALRLAEAPQPETTDPDATPLDRVIGLLVLDVYGREKGRMPRRVRADVGFAAMLIAVQMSLDLLAWFLGMKLVFVPGFGPAIGFPLALLFAVFFASTIAIFERSVLTADLGFGSVFRSATLWFRVAFVVGASFLTAVPLELFLFNDEIQHVLDADRGSQVGHAQDVLRGNVDGLIHQLDQKLDADLKRLEEQFAPLRAYVPATSTSVSPRLGTVERQIERVMGDMQREEEGSRSGHGGKGRRYKSLEGQLATLNRQLDLLTPTHNAELAELRKEARSHAESGELAYQQAIGTLRSDHEKARARLLDERAAIEKLPALELSRRARVPIDVADGFAARSRILSVLSETQPTVEWGVWGLRGVMVLFGLLVLVQKATFSTETKAYFSSMTQAAQGDRRAQGLYAGLLRIEALSPRDSRAARSATGRPGQDEPPEDDLPR